MIRHALIDEKRKTYEWMCLSDTAAAHMGGAEFSANPIPTWEEFQEAFEDWYYTKDGRKFGSVMIIFNENKEIGCTCRRTAFNPQTLQICSPYTIERTKAVRFFTGWLWSFGFYGDRRPFLKMDKAVLEIGLVDVMRHSIRCATHPQWRCSRWQR